MSNIKCKTCKNTFFSKWGTKYCSDKCRKLHRLKSTNIVCEICKKVFTQKAAKKYCSDKCRHKGRLITRKKYRDQNPEKISDHKKHIYRFKPGEKEKQKKRTDNWIKRNRAYYLAIQKAHRDKNKDRSKIYSREYNKKRKKEDPNFALAALLRTQLNQKLKMKNISKRYNRAIDLLGIEIKYFKKYLEHKFKPGMTWENRGKVWHIDHIIPISILDISKEENLKFAFHYRNLQPMFVKDNLKKSNKVFVPAEKGDKIRDMDVKIKNILKRVHPEHEIDFNFILKPIDERGIGIEIIFKHSVN